MLSSEVEAHRHGECGMFCPLCRWEEAECLHCGDAWLARCSGGRTECGFCEQEKAA